MSVKTIQSCERCGAEREIGQKESPDTGGWRTLNNGSLEATLCNGCVKDIVVAARQAAEDRAGENQ